MKLILIFILSFSCSFKSLLVSNLDYLMTDKIADELLLNSEQEDELRVDIKKLLNETKESAKDLKVKISKIEIEKSLPIEELKKQYLNIVRKIIPIISKYYFKLSVDQRKEFFSYHQNKNEEVKKQMIEMTIKSVSNKYDGFFGDINQKQKELIIQNFSMMKELSKRRINRRLEIQSALKRAKNFKEVLAAFEIFTQSLKKEDELNNKFFVFLSQMIMKTNKNQKETLKEKKIELVQILEYYLTNTY